MDTKYRGRNGTARTVNPGAALRRERAFTRAYKARVCSIFLAESTRKDRELEDRARDSTLIPSNEETRAASLSTKIHFSLYVSRKKNDRASSRLTGRSSEKEELAEPCATRQRHTCQKGRRGPGGGGPK